MIDAGVGLDQVVYGVGMGSGMGFAFLIVRWVAVFLAGRWDKKEEQIDAATKEVIAELRRQVEAMANRESAREKRLEAVEGELAECKRRHAESEAEVMKLRAQIQGYGDARQQAALIVAAERKVAKG